MTKHPEVGTRVRRTSTTLADGRELIYFDDSEPYVSGATTRRLDDPRPIGEVVMDQRVIAGIGNVYKSELLFIQRIDPWRPASTLDLAERTALMQQTLTLMIPNLRPGAGMRTTRASLGGPRQWVYGRSGEACMVCGTSIAMRRQGAAGRSTYYCPKCQGVAPGPG